MRKLIHNPIINLGCDAIATGHYARSSFGDFLEDQDISKNVKLLKAMDSVKDQTFFLSQIPQNALRSTMFPIGSLTKDVVKKIAKSTKGLEKFEKKKESMGICFIGKRKSGFQDFLKEYTESVTGKNSYVYSPKINFYRGDTFQFYVDIRFELIF